MLQFITHLLCALAHWTIPSCLHSTLFKHRSYIVCLLGCCPQSESSSRLWISCHSSMHPQSLAGRLALIWAWDTFDEWINMPCKCTNKNPSRLSDSESTNWSLPPCWTPIKIIAWQLIWHSYADLHHLMSCCIVLWFEIFIIIKHFTWGFMSCFHY